MKTNVIEQYGKGGGAEKSRTRTERCEKEREGIMWVVRSTRHAERAIGNQERENNSEIRRETSIKVLSFCCAQQPDTLQVAETESGKKRLPIKNRERKEKKGGGEKWGETYSGSLSGPAERQ